MMNRQRLYGCALSLALTMPLSIGASQHVVAQQLAAANPQDTSQIRSVRLSPNGNRLRLEIETAGGSRPQVFFTQQGNAWIGDITNAQLQIDGQSSFRQDSPAPGVRSIEAQQIGTDSVRVQILGNSAAPVGLLSERGPNKLVFDFAGLPNQPMANARPAAPANPTAEVPPAASPQAVPRSGSVATQPSDPAASVAPPSTAIVQNAPAAAPANPAPAARPALPQLSQVPRVNQLNQPQLPPGVANPATPQFGGRAVPPPSGDISTGTIILEPPTVDLGSKSTITLTLRDAPVADVLSLLVRRAGLNVVLNDVPPTTTISLDVRDSPLQETFNFVLRLKNLQARRVQQTVFIGTTLPGVTQRVVRSFRLNQAQIVDTTFRAGGLQANLGGVGVGGAGTGGEDIAVRGILPFLQALAAQGGPLEGVQFIPDTRTNSVTAVGTAQQLDVVAAQIAQLDVRKRQVMISLRLIDVQVENGSTLGASLGAASGNFSLSGAGGQGTTFGGTPLNQPAGSSVPTVGSDPGGAPAPGGAAAPGAIGFNTLNRLQQALAVRLDAAVRDGTAKILADPKLVVSDGGFSTVSIGQEIVSNVALLTDPATGRSSVTLVKGNAGVSLNLRNVRIDDNGFVSFDFSPQVSSPATTVTFQGTSVTLLNQRTLNSQQIRIRDGQTFVVSGLIQDTDRVSVDKVPLLGDIPLLGALFRRQTTSNVRNEVVLLVTPFINRDDVANGLPAGQPTP